MSTVYLILRLLLSRKNLRLFFLHHHQVIFAHRLVSCCKRALSKSSTQSLYRLFFHLNFGHNLTVCLQPLNLVSYLILPLLINNYGFVEVVYKYIIQIGLFVNNNSHKIICHQYIKTHHSKRLYSLTIQTTTK
jgi:hypothetical protein